MPGAGSLCPAGPCCACRQARVPRHQSVRRGPPRRRIILGVLRMARKAKTATTTSAKPARPASGPAFWLFKSEPDSFSWEQQKARGKKGEPWEGVRNFLARGNMKAMQLGDRGFFYHSNVGKEIVGIVEVCALAHQDASDATGVWKCVD